MVGVAVRNAIGAGDPREAVGRQRSRRERRRHGSELRRLFAAQREELGLAAVLAGDGDRVAAGEAGRAVASPARVADGAEQPLVRQVGERVGLDEGADLLDALLRRDQLALGGACRCRSSRGRSVGGAEIRRWTSRAPAARTMRTILREVVPRTIESSISTTRLPSRISLDRVELDLDAETSGWTAWAR